MNATTRIVTARPSDEDLPPGFEQVRIDSRIALVLPAAVAPSFRDTLQRRAEAETEKRHADARQRLREQADEDKLANEREQAEQDTAQAAALASSAKPAFSAEAAPGLALNDTDGLNPGVSR